MGEKKRCNAAQWRLDDTQTHTRKLSESRERHNSRESSQSPSPTQHVEQRRPVKLFSLLKSLCHDFALHCLALSYLAIHNKAHSPFYFLFFFIFARLIAVPRAYATKLAEGEKKKKERLTKPMHHRKAYRVKQKKKRNKRKNLEYLPSPLRGCLRSPSTVQRVPGMRHQSLHTPTHMFT